MESSCQNKWDSVQLGSLAEFKNGVNYSKDNFGKGMKVINVGDFKDYTFAKLDDLDEINPEGIVREKDLLKDNDILFVRSNGNRELIGRSVIVAGLKEKISHSAFTIRGRFVSEKAMPRFYAYVLRSPQIRQKLSAYGGGTNISNLNQQILNSLPVPFPPLETQRKIASILSAYDDLIENNTRRIKILEEMARMLYREWFINFRFPGHEQVRMVDSPLGQIPEGWEMMSFTDLADVLSGGTPKTTVAEYWDGSIPFFAPKDVPAFFYVTSTEKTITETGLKKCNSKLYPKETVFITARGTVGKVVMSAGNMAMNQSCYALAGKEGVSQPFLFLLTLQCVDYLKKNTGGATFDTIVVDTFQRLNVLRPPNDLIEVMTQKVRPILDLSLKLILKNQNLRQTRDLLLPKLISGEVVV